MNAVEVKRARLAEIRAARNNLTTEIANLDARSYDAPEARRAGYEQRRDGCNTAIARLDEEATELRAEIADLEQRIDQVRAAARNGRTEAGDGALGLGHGAGDEPPPNRGQLDGVLRAIERHADVMSDGAAERVEQLVRRDRRGLDAQYLEAVADDHYRSAFGLILAHGAADAMLRMTPQQQQAVRRVGQASEQRAMAEGTGSAGGYGVPFALDPSIILSNAGVMNPIRQIASVIQSCVSRVRLLTEFLWMRE